MGITRRARRTSRTFVVFAAVAAAPPSLADTRFAVIGDYGSTTAATAVADRLKLFKPSFVATVGDNVYTTGGTTAELDGALGGSVGAPKYGPFIKAPVGQPTTIRTATVNNFYPTIGNHDIDFDGGASKGLAFMSYTDLATDPAVTMPAGSQGRYYSAMKGDVELFALSSDTRDTTSGQAVGSAQRTWLMGPGGNDGALAANTGKWKVVLFHHPAYSTDTAAVGDNHGSNPYMQWGFGQAHVVFNGHSHDYERFSINGKPYVVEGTGGQSTDSFSAPLLNDPGNNNFSVYRDGDATRTSRHGFTIVDAGPHAMTSKHYTVVGDLLDSFTVTAPGVSAVESKSFKQNVAGYTGTKDVELREAGAAASATAISLNVDDDVDGATGGNQRAHALVRFNNVIGTGGTQVPRGAKIVSAALRIVVTNDGAGIRVHRMLQDWADTTATWAVFGGNGVQANDVEAALDYDVTVGTGDNNLNIPLSSSTVPAYFTLDVTDSVQRWADGDANYGWFLSSLSGGIQGIDFTSSEGAAPPELVVQYVTVPEPGVGAIGVVALLTLVRRRARP